MDLCSLSVLLDDLKITEAFLKKNSGLTFKEATLLCALGCGLSEPAKIAKNMNLSPSRTSRLISALEAKDLLIRNPSPVDKRVVNLALSQKGNDILEEIHKTDLPFPDYLQKALDEITKSLNRNN
jgi:DNA-binding MarR family transcriptional regulator